MYFDATTTRIEQPDYAATKLPGGVFNVPDRF